MNFIKLTLINKLFFDTWIPDRHYEFKSDFFCLVELELENFILQNKYNFGI